MKSMKSALLSAAVLAGTQGSTHASNFQLTDDISGSFDSTISVGAGARTRSPSASLITQGNVGGPDGQMGFSSPTPIFPAGAALGVGDQGTLNYGKGDFFTQYLKGSHELLLSFPEEFKFMARANWLRDFGATRTTGYISGQNAPETTAALQGGFTDEARSDVKFKARMLDLWVSKTFEVADRQVRIRAGNQVINWGESLFLPGGINATNASDIQRLSQPGTQLKEAVLPAPMVSVASGIAPGVNFEGYVQTRWNASYFPPTGSYWSVFNGLGSGHDAYFYGLTNPRRTGQWGVSLKWQPEGAQANFGIYALNYHDKTPQLSFGRNGGPFGFYFPEDRKLYGVSANLPLGDWAIGTELSYRPKDAVPLNGLGNGRDLPCNATANGPGDCWVDEARYQWHGTALFSATPSNAAGLLKLLGADTATFMFEAVVISYPGLRKTYNNGADLVSAGGWFWTDNPGFGGEPKAVGSKTSVGYNFDLSWVYDGTLIPGWQVVPELYFFHALKGRSPNGQLMEGAKSANLIVTFIRNPATWQFGINYAKFWGGATAFDQPYRDRDFVGAYVSRNF